MRAICILALVLAFAPAPNLRATWTSDHSATIAWQSSARACLSVRHATGQGVFIGCWQGGRRVTVTLGKVGSLDAAYRPTAGDLYILTNGSGVVLGRTPLRSVVYFPVAR